MMAPTHPSASMRRLFSETASMSIVETDTGSHSFKITNYSLQKGIGIGKFISSKIFHVGGCDWTIRCYPDGDREQNKSAYISVFLYLCSYKDVKIMFSMSLLDKNSKPWPEANFTSSVVLSPSKMSWGWPQFIKKDKLEKSKCLLDDCFTIKCELQVIKASRTDELPKKMKYMTVPPPNLHEHLGHLLESGKGADVTFIVAGESFDAHRSVLAARSSVFDAELFGSMKERIDRHIVIHDMEAQAFKALLHFIYTDTLPNIEELIGPNSEESATMLMQHLLVGTDRYELKRLKLICEKKLCECIDVSTLATTLALAEQHHCEKLKAICLEFLTDREKRLAVMATDGFKHLMDSCAPLILKELLEKL